MNQKKQRSPQEKKALSYTRDRRNTFGENDKASRKAIPLRKAIENRQDRRKVAQDLGQLPSLPEETAATVESSARQGLNRVGGWKKDPDKPLNEYLERKARMRVRHGLAPNRESSSEQEPV